MKVLDQQLDFLEKCPRMAWQKPLFWRTQLRTWITIMKLIEQILKTLLETTTQYEIIV